MPLLREVMADRANVTVRRSRRDAARLERHCSTRPSTNGWVLVANLPVQRGDAAHLRHPRHRPARPADDRDGAARGRRTIRRAAPNAGVRRGQREGGVLGHGARSSATCRRRCSCPDPTSSRRSWRSPRRTPPATAPDLLFTLVRTGFGQRRKMLRKVARRARHARTVRGRRRRSDRAGRGARRRRVVPTRRRRRSPPHDTP